GLMIGKGGRRVKEIESKYGVSIRVRNGVARFGCLSQERLFWAKVAFFSIRPPRQETHFSIPSNETIEEMEVLDQSNEHSKPSLAKRDLMSKFRKSTPRETPQME